MFSSNYTRCLMPFKDVHLSYRELQLAFSLGFPRQHSTSSIRTATTNIQTTKVGELICGKRLKDVPQCFSRCISGNVKYYEDTRVIFVTLLGGPVPKRKYFVIWVIILRKQSFFQVLIFCEGSTRVSVLVSGARTGRSHMRPGHVEHVIIPFFQPVGIILFERSASQ